MLTTLAMTLILGQFPSTCATCGSHGSSGGYEGATGWFPLFTDVGWERIRNACNGPILGLGANKCPCPLGTAVPYGDYWAMQMHGGFQSTSAPAPAATTTPPPPAPTPPPARDAGSAPSSGAPARPEVPSLPTGPAPPLP
jgi:hypothetical protein